MSEENVEIVARGYAQFSATGEFAEERTDPDFVWDMSTFAGWPERKIYEGTDGAREFLASWREAWDNWELEVEELVDAGAEQVLAVLRQRGVAKTTGLQVDMQFAQLWTMRAGNTSGCGCTRTRPRHGEPPGCRSSALDEKQHSYSGVSGRSDRRPDSSLATTPLVSENASSSPGLRRTRP